MALRENALNVYNTLTRSKERFEPLAPPHIGMYVCGPTVYGDAHLGHAKSYTSFDVILRYLRYLGYQVTYVQNITDVGHLTDNADQGEDKVETKARAEQVHPMQIAEHYTRRYFEDMDRLNVLRPDICPRASGHIVEQIELVKRLIARGYAYDAGGNVYFDVPKWVSYGKLSGRTLADMVAGTRVEPAADKRHPADFALWKRADAGHIMQWPSPWGPGFPGWHLECSAMSMKYLGESFDIHGGGMENQFPHHEDEIAQAEAATGKPFVKYWLHNNMVTVGGQKMGKSLGNFITLKAAYEKWDPMVVRFLILQSHYRSPLDFSEESLAAASEGFTRFRTVFRGANQVRAAFGAAPQMGGEIEANMAQTLENARARFLAAMDDDFNAPVGLSVLFDLVRQTNVCMAETVTEQDVGKKHRLVASLDQMIGLLRDLGTEVLGLEFGTEARGSGEGLTPQLVQLLIDLRNDARKAKNFAEADTIRMRLDEAGILLEDTPQGTKWRFK